MLKPLIYAAMMHNGKPKTVAEFERAAATVAEMLERRASEQPLPETLPHPGSPEADKMLDVLLTEYGHPANAKNAARAGYMAARRLLQHARQQLPAVDDAEPVYIRTLCKALDAALDFAGTVAGGASWWDDVWAELDAEVERTRQAYYTQSPAPAHEPVATLHDDGCFTWKRDEFRLRYDRQRAGWRMDVYAGPAPAVQDGKDAARFRWHYSGARTDSNALVALEIRLLNDEKPTLDEVRVAFDEAMAVSKPPVQGIGS